MLELKSWGSGWYGFSWVCPDSGDSVASSLGASEHGPDFLEALIPSWLPAVAVVCDGCGLSGVD